MGRCGKSGIKIDVENLKIMKWELFSDKKSKIISPDPKISWFVNILFPN